MKQLLLIGLGGFIGSIARYLVSKLNITWQFYNIPMGTLIVNIVGGLLIGFISGLLVHNILTGQNVKLFLITGVCGGFTTFSAFAYENVQLIQEGYNATAIIYIVSSILFSILAVLAGLWFSKMIV